MSAYKFIKKAVVSTKDIIKGRNTDEIDKYINDYKNRFGDFLSIKSKATSDKTLLIYSNHNIAYCMNMESIIAKKIQMEYGWRVVFVCTLHTIDLAKKICGGIYGFSDFVLIEDFMPLSPSNKQRVLKKIDLAKDIKEIEELEYKNTPIGIHSLATYSSTLPTATIELNQKNRDKIKKIATTSMRYVLASEKIISSIKPSLVVSIEKGSIGTCEMFYEAIKNDIAFIQYLGCHEPESIMLKRYNKNNIRMHPFSISQKSWDETEYTLQMELIVKKSFEDGYKNGDWFKYKNLSSDKKIVAKDELVKLLNLDPNKKNAIIFSHILNDANFFYGKDLFDGGFREWFVKTVEVASKNDSVNWLIKLHPANVFRRANQGYSGEYGEILAIKEYLGEVPKNIKVIPADIDINPYSFFMLADYGITVRGTVGAELPCFGIPVLTAGTGRYSHLGFTVDSESAKEYLSKVANIENIKPLDEEQIKLAIKHAYLFFRDRPTKYSDFLKDTYPKVGGAVGSRDIEPVGDIWKNNILKNISSFFIKANDEDFLMSKDYIK